MNGRSLREMTSARMCFKPIPTLIEELNEHLRGWANYFGRGYPRKAFREINAYVRKRLVLSSLSSQSTAMASAERDDLLRAICADGVDLFVNEILVISVHALGESLQESRMREIRTSGLTRGRGIPPSLLYCL